tara:strand:+ start:348 stop:683 length:336 start_codon:yes stop_codon:yes gene_type:complete
MSTRYSEITEHLKLEQNQVRAIYLNCCFSALSVLILIIIASMLGPVAKDAGILIKDAGDSLKDFSIMIPEINGLIPEAKNTTRILGHMIPKIIQGMNILKQLCIQDPECHI